MKQLIKPEPIHWWVLVLALLCGLAFFLAYRLYAY